MRDHLLEKLTRIINKFLFDELITFALSCTVHSQSQLALSYAELLDFGTDHSVQRVACLKGCQQADGTGEVYTLVFIQFRYTFSLQDVYVHGEVLFQFGVAHSAAKVQVLVVKH